MKRRGFLSLLAGLPFLPKALAAPAAEVVYDRVWSKAKWNPGFYAFGNKDYQYAGATEEMFEHFTKAYPNGFNGVQIEFTWGSTEEHV